MKAQNIIKENRDMLIKGKRTGTSKKACTHCGGSVSIYDCGDCTVFWCDDCSSNSTWLDVKK